MVQVGWGWLRWGGPGGVEVGEGGLVQLWGCGSGQGGSSGEGGDKRWGVGCKGQKEGQTLGGGGRG